MYKKIKILILYSGYKPAITYGGPVKSISNIVEYLGDEFEFYIIASNHELRSKERLTNIKDGWNQVGKAKVLYLSEKQLTIKNIQLKIKEILPDVIYLNSIFLYQFLISSLIYNKNSKSKIIITPRGELCNNAFKIKRLKKEIYIILLKYLKLKEKVYWQATSKEEEEEIQRKLHVPKSRIKYLEVLPQNMQKELYPKKKEKGKLKCVFISRICKKKNLIDAIKYVKNADKGITLDIYGFKEDENYWEKCEKEIEKENRIKYCGILKPDEVITTFQKYQLFLFPTYSENYGHIIAESMLGGCPVLISNQTPWKDLMEKQAGIIVKLGNDQEFIKKLNEIANLNNNEYQKLKRSCEIYINSKIEYSKIITEYKKMFEFRR